MDNWIYIKEEPLANEFYEVNSEYCDPADSCFTFGSEESCDVKIDNEEFPKIERDSDDAWKAKSFHNPELSVRLVPLKYSKNREAKKCLESSKSDVAPSAECGTRETTAIELNQIVKIESIELETLNETTLARSLLENTRYASPWDFVEISNRYGEINIETEDTNKKHKYDSMNFNLPQRVQNEVEETAEEFALPNSDRSAKKKRKLNEKSGTAEDIKKQWECDICKRKFNKRDQISQHMQTHYPKTFVCDWCPRSYSYRSTLRRHVEVHNKGNEEKKKIKYSRVQCNFPEICRVQRDFPETRLKKPNINKIKKKVEIEASNKCFECDVCHERFEMKSDMRVHIEFLHIELNGKQINKPKTKPKRKNFKCITCGKRYTQSSHLYRHEAIHFSDKTYNCDKCDVKFGRKSTLSRHMLLKHSEKYVGRSKESKGEKEESRKKVKVTLTNYTCKICEKSFKTNHDLRRHCAIHDRRKPYECDICKKQFALKSYLYAHVITHDNWQPYPCDKCDKSYRRKSSLQRHVELNHSGKKKSTCHICFKSYKHLPSYTAHMETHNRN